MDTRLLGRYVFALGMMGLGAISLVFGKYALQWEPVPAGFPGWLAYGSGAVLVLGGAGIFIKRIGMTSAAVLTAFLAVWVFALQGPGAWAAVTAPGAFKSLAVSGGLLGFCEDLALMSGAWTVMILASVNNDEPVIPWITDDRGLRIARTLFGLACLVFGVSHFAFLDITAGMIPAWWPAHRLFAGLTGAGHLLAGVALITGILKRTAVRLEALMMSLFVAIVHIPMLLAHPKPEDLQLDWTMLFVAISLAASAWAIAGGLRELAEEEA